MIDIKVIRKFRGYENYQEPTNIDSARKGVLVPPSKNIWTSTQGVVHSRMGYEQIGSQMKDVNDEPVPIVFEDEWQTNRGDVLTFRAGGRELQVFYDSDWVTIKKDLVSPKLFGSPWWDDTATIDKYLFVDKGDSIHSWSGGLGTIAEVDIPGKRLRIKTSTTVLSWAGRGFNTASAGRLYIDGVDYPYDAADGSEWLSLDNSSTVTNDMVGKVGVDRVISTNTFDYSIRTGSTIAHQEGRNIQTDFGFELDIIQVQNNQIILTSDVHTRVFISKNTSFSDFRFSEQRLIGEGDSFILDSPVNNVKVGDGVWYVSCGNKLWYEIKEERHQISFNAAYHSVNRLKTGFGQGAHNKYSADYVKDNIIFVSKEPTLDTLGRVDKINTPKSQPLSQVIDNDFKNLDFTDVHVKYFKNNIFISLPVEGIMLIRDLEQGIWQTPQTIPSNCTSILDNELIFHDGSGRSHKAFTTFKDGVVIENGELISKGSPIQAEAFLSYESYMNRALYKSIDKLFVETYMTDETVLKVGANFEYGGVSSDANNGFELSVGSEFSSVFKDSVSAGIGMSPLGLNPFGSILGKNVRETNFHKVRGHISYSPNNFFEMQHVFSSETFFMLVSYGSDYKLVADNAFNSDNGKGEAVEQLD